MRCTAMLQPLCRTSAMASASKSLLFFRRATRAYATSNSNSDSDSYNSNKFADVAQATSAPLKVQDKRAQIETAFARNPEDSALTVEEKRDYVRPPVLRDSDRSRLRGVRTMRRSDGTTNEQIIGQRIYLPNIIFTLVRNQTPPGKPYNPYEATFYVPQNITKTDIRSYLHAIYGVECTYIRTDNYYVPIKQRHAETIGRLQTPRGPKRSHKRAVVGLKQPFYYPHMVEDMNGKDRWLRESALEDAFHLKHIKTVQKAMTIKFDKTTGIGGQRENDIEKLASLWDTRKKIIRRLWERREEREQRAREIAKGLQEVRK